MKTKLIIVSGMSGAGKSTTSQYISKLYKDNGIDNIWYHEEMDNHPIRWKDGGEFKVADYRTEQGMKLNIEDLLSRWRVFIESIKSSDKVHVMEGCIFQNIVRYFFPAAYKHELIKNFYHKLFEIISQVDSTFVFLYSTNPQKTLEKAFITRGESWKKITLDPGDELYYKINGYKGDESIYAMWTDCRDLSKTIFDNLTIDKLILKINPEENQWQAHHKKIAEHFALSYMGENDSRVDHADKYCGSMFTKEGDKTSVTISKENNRLFLHFSWFNKILLIPTKQDTFQLSAFPTKITYTFDSSATRIKFDGNYGWEINGQEFIIKAE
jgi:tRNA uridine 5-carbamoylmethylation protein Kti12